MDLQTLQQEHEELQGELRGLTDKAKKAGCEVKDIIEGWRFNTCSVI